MKAKYYHYRNEQGAPVVTQCLIIGHTGDVLAVGNSICSPCENPSKKFGREQAFNRASNALDDYLRGVDQCPKSFVGSSALYTLSTVDWSKYIHPHYTVFLYGYVIKHHRLLNLKWLAV